MMKMTRILVPLIAALLAVTLVGGASTALAAPPASGPQVHVVQPGETLYSISWRNGTTVQALMAANGLHSTLIYSGQSLVIPGPGGMVAQPAAVPATSTYVVQAGDTLYSIATRNGISVEALMQANGLSNTWIWTGQQLIIPNGSAPVAVPVPQSAAPQIYVVVWGDTLYSIAWRFGIPVGVLAQANGISPDGWVYAGQRLIIPSEAHPPAPPAYGAPTAPTGPATYYNCQPGDTLNGIAYRYDMSPWALAQANGLSYNAWVYPGQQLVIPGVYQQPPPPPPSYAQPAVGCDGCAPPPPSTCDGCAPPPPSYAPPPVSCDGCPPPPPATCDGCPPPSAEPAPPVVSVVWEGRVISNTNSTGDTREMNSVIRVTMPGRKDWPVTVWALPIQDSTFHITGRTGTKPELGEYAVEFAPFKAGWYAVYPEDLDVRMDIYLDGHGTIYLEFAQVSLVGPPY